MDTEKKTKLTVEQVRGMLVRIAGLALRFERSLGRSLPSFSELSCDVLQWEHFANDEQRVLARIVGILNDLDAKIAKEQLTERFAQMVPWVAYWIKKIRQSEEPQRMAEEAARTFTSVVGAYYGVEVADDFLLKAIDEAISGADLKVPSHERGKGSRFEDLPFRDRFDEFVRASRGPVLAAERILGACANSQSYGTIHNRRKRVWANRVLYPSFFEQIMDFAFVNQVAGEPPDERKMLSDYLIEVAQTYPETARKTKRYTKPRIESRSVR